MTALAPLALFVFRRPSHTRLVLEALKQCPELAKTPLYVFADGARHDGDAEPVEETRKLVADFDHPQKTLCFSSSNLGLAASVIAGVTSLCHEFGRVIVLEDDLIVSPLFLSYMNQALNAYETQSRISSINAFSFGDLSHVTGGRVLFLRYAHPWGWATWQRAWGQFDPDASYLDAIAATRDSAHHFNLHGADDYMLMLRRQQKGELDSWWIRWYANTFLTDSLGVFPPVPMVRSIGADRSATHMQFSERLLQPARTKLASLDPILPDRPYFDAAGYAAFRSAMRPRLRRALRVLGGAKRRLLHA